MRCLNGRRQLWYRFSPTFSIIPQRSSVYSSRKTMVLGKPLRAAISFSRRVSPALRNASSNCDEWMTDFTKYGSRLRTGTLMVTSNYLLQCKIYQERSGAEFLVADETACRAGSRRHFTVQNQRPALEKTTIKQ